MRMSVSLDTPRFASGDDSGLGVAAMCETSISGLVRDGAALQTATLSRLELGTFQEAVKQCPKERRSSAS